MADLTVSAGLARGLLNFAISRGASEASLAADADIALDMLSDQDNRVPFPNYVRLMRAAKRACSDPALALHYGAIDDFAQISVVGLIGEASENMIEAFQQLNRYGKLVIEVNYDGGDRFQIVREEGELLMCDVRPNPNDFHELTESTFARMVCGVRRFSPEPIVQRIYVTHERPDYAVEYDRVFGIPVVFGAKRNALSMSDAWLTLRLALQPRYVFGILTEHADGLLQSLENSKTLRGRIESLLMPVLHKGNFSADAVSQSLGISRQTMFRRLKGEGTTFEKVLDELRHRMALHYLNGKKVSVSETAYLVGFSEAAAFSRAFKRWTGKSPRDVRAGHYIQVTR